MCPLKLWISFGSAGEGSLSNTEDIITPGIVGRFNQSNSEGK